MRSAQPFCRLGWSLLTLLGLALVQPAHAEIIDRIAAVVNNEIITLRQVRRAAAPGLANLSQLGDPAAMRQAEERLLRETLDELVDQILLAQNAEELKISVTTEDVDAHVAQVKSQYGWDDGRMADVLSQEGSSLDEFRTDVRRRLNTQRLVQMRLGSSIRVSEEEVEEALQKEYSLLGPERALTVRHLLLLVPEHATPDAEAQIGRRAQELKRQALEPGTDFGQLARAHSEAPGADRGIELANITRNTLEPCIEEAIFPAEVGEVIGPVRCRYGYHLFQVTHSREVGPRDEQELRQEITNRLRQEALTVALRRWTAELRKKAYVDVKLRTGTSPQPPAAERSADHPSGATGPDR